MRRALPQLIPIRVANTLPGRVARRLIPGMEIDFGPLNGQSGRQALIVALLRSASVEVVFETGTYVGSSTLLFARHFSGPIHSVEANPDYLRIARRRTAGATNVTLREGDSRDALRSWAAEDGLAGKRALFYLDAHWHEDLPLAEELELIARKWEDPIVVVDDFEVPGDPVYEFDDHGPGKRLSLDYIPAGLRSLWVPLFPSLRGSQEDGCRRGCVVLVPVRQASSLTELLPALPASWPAGSQD
ncbi:MAG: hypothetical protein NTX07_01785 [Solirubrobacterales bacterium]|nr:hypothetical protein [Solirubrobacterales bacterium]